MGGIGGSFRGDAIEDRTSVPFVDAKETQLLFSDGGDAVTLVEDGKQRLRLTKSNMPDWILWNTGAENGSGLKDLKEGEYKKYVCVEPGLPLGLSRWQPVPLGLPRTRHAFSKQHRCLNWLRIPKFLFGRFSRICLAFQLRVARTSKSFSSTHSVAIAPKCQQNQIFIEG